MRALPASLATAACAVTLLLPSTAHAQASTIYACALSSSTGQLRIVSGEGQCKANETEVHWQSGGATPRVVPLALRSMTGRGNALGCDLEVDTSGEGLFRVRCNEFADTTTLKSGTAIFMQTPPDQAYAYDGLYVCGVASEGLRARNAVFRLVLYFDELQIDATGTRVLQKRNSSIDATRRGLRFDINATDLTPLETDASTAGRRPCVTLPFSQGIQDGGQPRLPGDVWVPTTDVTLFLQMPAMLPVATGQFGDFLLVSQVGLAVAGPRPAGQ
jgi:hypothetical protein